MSGGTLERLRWQEVCAAFEGAMELAPEGRPAGLARIEDPVLRARVASLLRWQEAGEAFEESPLAPARASALARAEVGELPRELGRYRLLEVLGRGGMGVVYLAERIDGEYEQRVAVKLLPRGLDDAERIQRFRAERQILAGLDHPAIAKLLDGGTSQEGLPYLVMEFVEGEPIDQHARRLGLKLESRLRLFLRVCEAVHYAHQRLVVHRDLKPTNLLVSERGEPKLLDFGIAKLLSLSEQDRPAMTEYPDARPMTPEYASPEQVRGEAITTAADVYSLGALLYELLTGQRAHRFASRTPLEIERTVCEQPPVPPSEAAVGEQHPAGSDERAIRRWRRRLAGDLDTILLTALRKEPQRRYSTVAELAQDLERFLAGLPVRAQRDTLRYRLGKWVRRHRGRLAVAAGLGALLIGLGGGALLQYQRARVQSESAAALSGLLREVFAAPDPGTARGRPLTVEQVLARGVAQIEARRDLDPRIAANLLDTVGSVLSGLGDYREAEAVHERARATRSAHGAGHAVERVTGLRLLGEAILSQGESARSESPFREAVSVARAELGETEPELALAVGALANSLRWQGKLDEAGRGFDEALALARPLLAEPNPAADEVEPYAELVSILNRTARMRGDQGRLDEAEALARESLGAYQRLRAAPHPNLAYALHNLGRLHYIRADYPEAEARLREALSMRRALHGDAHPTVIATKDLLAIALEARGRFGESIEIGEQAARGYGDSLGAEHASTLRANTLHAVLRGLVEPRAASEPVLRAALRRNHDVLGPESSLALSLDAQSADVFLLWGEVEEAERALSVMLEQRAALLADSPIDRGTLLAARARALAGMGDLERARRLGGEALEILRPVLGERHDQVGLLLQLASELDLAAGDAVTAEQSAASALEILRERLGPRHARALRAVPTRVKALLALGRVEEADRLLREVMPALEASPPEGGPVLDELRVATAAVLARQGREAEARRLLIEAERALRQFWGDRAPAVADARTALAALGGRWP